MRPSRAVVLALAMMCVSSPAAMAQGGAQCNDFVKLRADADQKATAIRTLTSNSQHRPEQKELCGLFQRFASAEASMLKFLEVNKVWCGVPDQAIKTAKLNHEKTLKLRTSICSGGPVGQESRPKPPSLSDALGAPSIDTPSNTKTGRGTFDTLTGSPLVK
jgi:hypothetical protein